MNWKVEYGTDTGSDDECFFEYWDVSNGVRSFRANEEADARWLCSFLNQHAGDEVEVQAKGNSKKRK